MLRSVRLMRVMPRTFSKKKSSKPVTSDDRIQGTTIKSVPGNQVNLTSLQIMKKVFFQDIQKFFLQLLLKMKN